MKTFRTTALIGLSLALSAAIAPIAIAQDAPPAAPAGPGSGSGKGGQGAPRGEGGEQRGGRGGAQAVSLEGSMKGMNRALKALKGAVGDASKKNDCLKMVSEMQRNCAASKTASVPAEYLKNAADAAAKAKIEDEFRSELRTNMRLLLDLEDAIVAGKTDEATALIAKVEALRDHAHKEMGVKD
ncbi:MAG: hypothetical protein WCO75_04890 [Planctomycetota bacterium]